MTRLPSLALVLVLCALPPARPSAAQETAGRAETEQRLEALRAQIEADRSRLSQTTQAEQASLANVRTMEREIALREELVRTYRRRMRELSFASDSLRTSLVALEATVGELKAEYRRRAIHGYKYGRSHDLALILSAGSINQMIIRVQYLHRFAQQRQDRLHAIADVVDELASQRETLQSTRVRTETLLAQARDEEDDLSELRQQHARQAKTLRQESAALQAELKRKEAAKSELENLLRRLASAEAARRRSLEASNPEAARSEARASAVLTGSFLDNRGRLPWPADGAVQEPFGRRVSPTYGTVTTNPGLFLATAAGAEVRAVFSGEVTLVDVMPDFGRLVTIAHGDYTTVYANFSSLDVQPGAAVRAGQVLGRAGTDGEPRGRGVFFAVFKDGQPLDPTPWLTGR